MNHETERQELDEQLHELFGVETTSDGPLATSGAGLRL